MLSGKGGVGKSSITTQLALSLALSSHTVGILDIDLTGPSIPRLLSIESSKITQSPSGWLPVCVHPTLAPTAAHPSGISSLHAISLALLLPSRSSSVVWRGPKKTAMVRQFLSDVVWPPGTDYLLIDTPPGTSDEHISLAESLLALTAGSGKLAGAVIVTTPQAVSTADVRKELSFCRTVKIPVLGVVENMAGFVCPHCSECTDLFGRGGGEEMAREWGVGFLGSVPIDPQWGSLVEEGRRGRYPVGTVVDGKEFRGDGVVDDGRGERQDERLVEKYTSCSLCPIFAKITRDLVGRIEAGESNGDGRRAVATIPASTTAQVS